MCVVLLLVFLSLLGLVLWLLVALLLPPYKFMSYPLKWWIVPPSKLLGNLFVGFEMRLQFSSIFVCGIVYLNYGRSRSIMIALLLHVGQV